jgi:CHAT domain-containing protein/tetratricopeptide (TPR) repeat protein
VRDAETPDEDARAELGLIIEQLRGGKAEDAPGLCRRALSLIDREQQPDLWFFMQGALGEATARSSDGDQAANLAEGIAACRSALSYFTRKRDPETWAQVTLTLANLSRKQGDLDEAIACQEQALEVIQRGSGPPGWFARLTDQLGDDYGARQSGSPEENRQRAMHYYAVALDASPPGVPDPGEKIARKLAKLSAGHRDARSRELQDLAIEWLEGLVGYLRQAANPGNKASAIAGLNAALGSDSPAGLQEATQRMLPYMLLSNALSTLGWEYARRINGDPGENQERAIAALEEALSDTPDEDAPDVWASRAGVLADLYRARRGGDRSENFGRAIGLYRNALDGPIRQIDPQSWLSLILRLVDAYDQRKESDAEDVERLVRYLKQAGELRNPKDHPSDWARIQAALGQVELMRPTGDRADHLERAIDYFRSGIAGFGEEADALARSAVLNDLGIAFARRIRGDGVENVEQALLYLQQALKARRRETHPSEWAQSTINLGINYFRRERGDPAENFEKAIKCYKQTLKVITRESDPLGWATVMHNLGNVYSRRIKGDRADNMERARKALEQVLTVRTRSNVPDDWAITMSNLGKVYLNRVKGDAVRNYETGIEYCREAMLVRTRERMPYEWAETLNHLGNLNHELYKIKKAEAAAAPAEWARHFEAAREAYRNGLEVHTPEANASGCLPLAISLGNLEAGEEHWHESLPPYRSAIQAAETLYRASLLRSTGDIQLARIGDLFRRAAYAMARAGQARESVCTLEQGRARGLNRRLALDRADLSRVEIEAPEAFAQYRDAAARLRKIEDADQSLGKQGLPGAASRDKLRDEADSARRALDGALDRIRAVPGYEGFLMPPQWEDIAAQVEPGAPLVYLAGARDGLLTAFLFRKSAADPVTLETWCDERLGENDLVTLLGGDQESAPQGWFTAYFARGKDLLGWKETVDRVNNRLWDEVMQPVMDKLQAVGGSDPILVPCGLLALLPLHAAWSEQNGERTYALDLAAIRYVPSARVLGAARRISASSGSGQALVVSDPAPVHSAAPLSNAAAEAEVVAAWYEQPVLLEHSAATREDTLAALPAARVAHFCCHGGTDWDERLRSGLLLANDEVLTVADLLSLRLEGSRLAVLSACETAIVGTRLPDEVLALPSALLQAGFAGVIASMWSVFDVSTAVLMSRFYQLWVGDGLEPHRALGGAIRWLRAQTAAELAAVFEKAREHAADSGGARYDEASEAWQHFAYDYSGNERPYAHAIYWAPFTYTGV